MAQISKVFNVVTNIKDKKGNNVCIAVQAVNAINAIYVVSETVYNGQRISDENVIKVECIMDRVVTSYYTKEVEDLDPNYKPLPDKENKD